jgi:hypothetical protein
MSRVRTDRFATKASVRLTLAAHFREVKVPLSVTYSLATPRG